MAIGFIAAFIYANNFVLTFKLCRETFGKSYAHSDDSEYCYFTKMLYMVFMVSLGVACTILPIVMIMMGITHVIQAVEYLHYS